MIIKTIHNDSVFVDKVDFDYLINFRWTLINGYSVRIINSLPIFMHNEIMANMINRELNQYEEVDHKDLDILNNRRQNLRIATHSQNNANKLKYLNNTSGYKGVTWSFRNKKWKAQIKVNYTNHHLGLFDDLIEAALAYDQAAKYYFGEFANLNFP